jgi:hypothetical protein
MGQMVDPNHTVDRRRAHIRVGAAATATFLLFLLIGAFHGPASADPSAAPAAAPAATSTPTPESTPDPGQQQSPPFRGGRRWGGHRGYGAPPQGMPLPDDGSGQPSIPLPDDDSGQPTVPEPDNSGSGGQIS